MWSWFSGAGAQRRKDGPKNAILLLRQQLDMLQKREKHLENQMNEQEAIARKVLATNKAGTLKLPELEAISYHRYWAAVSHIAWAVDLLIKNLK